MAVSMSGRLCRCRAPATSRRPLAFSSRLVTCSSNARAFEFASIGKDSGRRHRAADKREAERSLALVKDLCALTPKQLQALSPHMDPLHHRELLLARSLPHTNQGRQRQERLLAKILQRDLDAAGLRELQELARSADLSAGSLRLSPQQEALLSYWRAGLVEGQQEAEVDALQAATQAGGSSMVQQLRQLIRQCREAKTQLEEEQRQHWGGSPPPSPSGSATEEDEDEEDGAAVAAALQAGRQTPALLAAQKAFKRKRSKLNKALKDLVLRQGGGGAAGDE